MFNCVPCIRQTFPLSHFVITQPETKQVTSRATTKESLPFACYAWLRFECCLNQKEGPSLHYVGFSGQHDNKVAGFSIQ